MWSRFHGGAELGRPTSRSVFGIQTGRRKILGGRTARKKPLRSFSSPLLPLPFLDFLLDEPPSPFETSLFLGSEVFPGWPWNRRTLRRCEWVGGMDVARRWNSREERRTTRAGRRGTELEGVGE